MKTRSSLAKSILSMLCALTMMLGVVTMAIPTVSAADATIAPTLPESGVTYPTSEGKWSGSRTENLIVTPALPNYSQDSGKDVAKWQSNWDKVMVPAGWGSLYVTGYDNALQVYATTAKDGTTPTFAIRPTTKGTDGTNANLGGAGDADVYDGGVSYTIQLTEYEQYVANSGLLEIDAYAEFWLEEDYAAYLAITIEYIDRNGKILKQDRRTDSYSASSGYGSVYVMHSAKDYIVPEDTVYIRTWFCCNGTGDSRKTVKNMEIYLNDNFYSTSFHGNSVANIFDSSSGALKDYPYILSGHRTLSSNLYITGNTTLCLCGRTMNMGNYSIIIEAGGTLTIRDCRKYGKLTSTGGQTAWNNICATIINKGTLKLEGGTIECTDETATTRLGAGIACIEGGTLHMSGGTVSAPHYGIAANGGTVNVSGGNVSATCKATSSTSSYSAVYATNKSEASIFGGTLEASKNAVWYDNSDLYLYSSPTLRSDDANIYAKAGPFYASNKMETLPYRGAPLTVGLSSSFKEGAAIVQNITAQNASSFTVLKNGYILARGNDELFGSLLLLTTVTESVFETVRITLSTDITVNYYVKDNGYVDPQMHFSLNGYETTVSGVLTDGRYKFSFDGVAPQWIGDTITAELIVGDTVIETKEYSVLRYLNSLKAMSAVSLGYSAEKYNAMVKLINDLLVYGGAAQTYKQHNTDALVSEGIAGSYRPAPTETDMTCIGNGYHGVTFTGMAVFFDNANSLLFRFTAEELSGISFKLKINGGAEKTVDYQDTGDYYIIKTDAMTATGFDDVYTLTVYYNGVSAIQLTYSVKSYVYSKQNGTDAMAALAKATYKYGLAAKEFVAAQ